MENKESKILDDSFDLPDIKKELDIIMEKNPNAIKEFLKEQWWLLPILAFAVIEIKNKMETEKEDEE